MARLYKRRGRPGYYYQAHNKRVATGCTDREAAKAWVREYERSRVDPTYATARETGLEEIFLAYLRHQENERRAAGTQRMNRQHAGHYLRILGDMPVLRLTAERVDHYIDVRTREGTGRGTLYKELSTLRKCLKVAKRRGFFPRDIDAVMPSGFRQEYIPRTRKLSLAEVEALMAQLLPHRAAFVAFVVATSARQAEAESSAKGDIGPRAIKLRGTKTALAARVVPRLPLYEHLVARAKPHLPLGKWGNASRDLELACARADIPKCTLNDLRRSCASIIRAHGRGVPADLLAAMLGHTDSRMVERVYGRLTSDELGGLIAQHTGTKTVPELGAGGDNRGKQGSYEQ